MSHSHHEAPRELVAVLWSIAGLIAIFLAISVSSLFILKYYFPISADTAGVATKTIAGKCKEGSEIAINNFPGQTAISSNVSGNSNDKTSEVAKPLGGDFQCSVICVTTVAPGTTVDQATKSKISEYFTGGTIGGKPIVITNTGEDFMKKILEWQKETDASKKDLLAQDLQRTIITSSNKLPINSSCAGPNSKDYVGEIVAKGKVVPITKENTSVDDAAKAAAAKAAVDKAAAANQAAGSSNIQPETPAQGAAATSFKAPAGASGSGSAGSGSGTASSTASPDLATCSKKVNDFLYKYQQLLNQVPADQDQPNPDITRYGEIRDSYQGLKKAPFLGDEEKSFKKCLDIEKLVNAMSTKLWGTKTELAICKKQVNDFLAKYPLDQTQSDDLRQTRYKVALDYYNMKYMPWYWVSAIRQLNTCKEDLPFMSKYRTAMGGAGPLLTDSQLGPVTDEQANAGRVMLDQKAADVAQAAQYALNAETASFWSEPSWNLANFGLGRRARYTWKIYNKARGIEATLLKNAGQDGAFWSVQYKNTYYYYDTDAGLWTAVQGKIDLWKLDPVGQVIPLPKPFL